MRAWARCVGVRLVVHIAAKGGKSMRMGKGMTPEQKELYDRIIDDRGKTGAKGGFAVTNDDGSLVGPWNAMVSSPLIGGLAERMGSFCRHHNKCPADLYEVGILVVGAEWLSQFEWFAHEKLALKAGVLPEAIDSIKSQAEPGSARGMTPEQLAVYTYARELHSTKRVSDDTHQKALAAVGGEQALIDLVFTMGFYHQMLGSGVGPWFLFLGFGFRV
ncbi:unnamed protein product [Symbiodinium natans]|uniref:Carboxymuconolactone decarboxylase-like domain-containing protein n=1 Tax=Symbiodinium natans TaxID=878477 RepID=A0A812QF54_9DINO|nr:unnamed protein product [Symbiodinium natans]